MISSNKISLGLVGTNLEQTYYVQAPYRCTLFKARATAQNSDIGDADTVTIKKGSTIIGTLTFGTDIAAGAKATWAADATNGKTVFEEGDLITVVVSALDAAGDRVHVEIDLDPHARTVT